MTSAISRNPQKTRPFHLTLRHSGLPRRRRNLQLQIMRSAIRIEFRRTRTQRSGARYCLLSVSSRLRITRAASVQAAASWGLIP